MTRQTDSETPALLCAGASLMAWHAHGFACIGMHGMHGMTLVRIDLLA